MSNYCSNCGNKTNGGICSNCQEELYISTYQSEDIDFVVSDEFAKKVKAQRKENERQKYQQNR